MFHLNTLFVAFYAGKNGMKIFFSSVQFSSVAQSCPTLCDPMNYSMAGVPVHHQLPEFTQTHVQSSRWCHPAISSSVIPFSSCSQSLPASVFSSESTLFMMWTKYWSFSFSIIPSKEHPGLISFRWISLQSRASQESSQSSQSNSRIHTWPLEKP